VFSAGFHLFCEEYIALDIEFNDAGLIDTDGTGWILGFGDWLNKDKTGPLLRYLPRDTRSHSLCMKWMNHRKGDPLGTGKPVSEGRALSILVSAEGRFRIQFCEDAGFAESAIVEHVLERHGHLSAWGAGVHHRWFVDEDCTILTLRWIPDVLS
jgi:hypothetical protein